MAISFYNIEKEYRKLKRDIDFELLDVMKNHIREAENDIESFINDAFSSGDLVASDCRKKVEKIMNCEEWEWPSSHINIPQGVLELFDVFPILKCRTEQFLESLEKSYNMDDEGKRSCEKILEQIDAFVNKYSECFDTDKRIYYWYKLYCLDLAVSSSKSSSNELYYLIYKYKERFNENSIEWKAFSWRAFGVLSKLPYEDYEWKNVEHLVEFFDSAKSTEPSNQEINYTSNLEREIVEKELESAIKSVNRPNDENRVVFLNDGSQQRDYTSLRERIILKTFTRYKDQKTEITARGELLTLLSKSTLLKLIRDTDAFDLEKSVRMSLFELKVSEYIGNEKCEEYLINKNTTWEEEVKKGVADESLLAYIKGLSMFNECLLDIARWICANYDLVFNEDQQQCITGEELKTLLANFKKYFSSNIVEWKYAYEWRLIEKHLSLIESDTENNESDTLGERIIGTLSDLGLDYKGLQEAQMHYSGRVKGLNWAKAIADGEQVYEFLMENHGNDFSGATIYWSKVVESMVKVIIYDNIINYANKKSDMDILAHVYEQEKRKKDFSIGTFTYMVSKLPKKVKTMADAFKIDRNELSDLDKKVQKFQNHRNEAAHREPVEMRNAITARKLAIEATGIINQIIKIDSNSRKS